MLSYNSQVGEGMYRIQFETDDKAHYERVQNVIRDCIRPELVENVWKDVVHCVQFAKRFPDKRDFFFGIACGKASVLFLLGEREKYQRLEELSIVCFKEGEFEKFLEENASYLEG